jgi:hypothetical protein
MTQGEVDWLGEIATLPRPILDHWRSRTPIAPVVLDTGTFEIAPEDETRELHHTTMRSFAVFNTGKRPEEIIAHYVQIVKIGGETRQGPGTGEEPRDRIDRANQIRARAELRSNCRKYLQVAEPDRTPQAVEQILLAMLEYLDGEEMASAANHDATMCEDAARAATKA